MKIYCYYFLIVAGLLLSSCSNPSNYVAADDVFVVDDVVYAVGSTCEGTSLTDCPTLWINGDMKKIGSVGNFNTATSVYVHNGDVYVTTCEDDICYLWKNGEKKIIDGATELSSIFVTDRNVYIAGSYQSQPAIWINNDIHILSFEIGCVNDILVYANDVYAVGCLGSFSNTQAVLWKNEEMKRLSDYTSDTSAAYDILIHNLKIYIAGEYNNKATLWIDEQPLILENARSTAYSVALLGNDIYVGGQGFDKDLRSESRLWKNGEILPIGSEMGYEIESIFAVSNKLYVAGTGNDCDPIWILNE